MNMSSQSTTDLSKLKALVIWKGGEDNGRYTSGISCEWIKNFNYEEWLYADPEDEDHICYVIEWRDTAKPPLGGWKVYNGLVIEISDSNAVLQRAERKLVGIPPSPRLKLSAIPKDLSSKPTKPMRLVVKPPTKKKAENAKRVPAGIKSTVEEPIPKSFKTPRSKKQIPEDEPDGEDLSLQKEQSSPEDDEETIGDDESAPIHSDSEEIIVTGDDQRLKNANKGENPASSIEENAVVPVGCLTEVLAGLQRSIDKLTQVENRGKKRKISGVVNVTAESSDEENAEEKEEPLVEIGKKGSGVFLPESQWRIVKRKDTYTKMGISLVMSLFPMEVLLQSNLSGGKRKVALKPGEEAVHYKALDPKIKDAIYDTVEKRFPKQFNKSQLGLAINVTLGNMRNKKKEEEAEKSKD